MAAWGVITVSLIGEAHFGPAQRADLDDADIEQLARYALLIEDHYGRPMDIEWGKDGEDGATEDGATEGGATEGGAEGGESGETP